MARSFNGSSDKVTLAAAFDLGALGISNGRPVSYSFWANVTSVSGFPIVYSDSGTGGVAMYFNNTAHFIIDNHNINNAYTSNGTITTGVWQNHVFTSDAGGTLAYYINGVKDSATSGGYTPASGKGPYRIGTEGTHFFVGSLADMAVWNNIVLTQAEATALANGARAVNIRPASIYSWLPFDGIQSPEPDFSGSLFNGTLTGTALASGPPMGMFTPRWPLNSSIGITTSTSSSTGAGGGFQAAWARGQRFVNQGIGV